MLNALKSLKRMKLMAFLIMLQLSIGLSLLNSTATVIDETNLKLSSFEKLFTHDSTYMVNTTSTRTIAEDDYLVENGEFEQKMQEDIYARYKFYDDINDLKNKNIIQQAKIYFCAANPSVGGLDNVKTKYSDLGIAQKMKYTSRINVNYDFINKYNLEISEGRSFLKEDFSIDYKTEKIPIIIGEDYKGSVKVGDTFKDQVISDIIAPYEEALDKTPIIPVSDEDNAGVETHIIENKVKSTTLKVVDVEYEVVGFYKHNAIPGLLTSREIVSNLIYSDAFIIIPTVDELAYINEGTCIERGGFFLEVNDPNYIDYINDKFKEDLLAKNINLEILPLRDEFTRYKESLIKDVVNSIALGGTLTFLSIIGIVSVLLGELNKRKKEFGIRIAVGSTIRTLCTELVMEIFLLVTLSTSFSLLILLAKGAFKNKPAMITPTVLLIDLVVIVILTVIISILPVIRTRKMNPIDLVRGK